MNDKLWCIIYDIRDNNITLPITIANKTINSEEDVHELMEDVQKLEWIAKSRRVTSEEYGKIKETVSEYSVTVSVAAPTVRVAFAVVTTKSSPLTKALVGAELRNSVEDSLSSTTVVITWSTPPWTISVPVAVVSVTLFPLLMDFRILS